MCNILSFFGVSLKGQLLLNDEPDSYPSFSSIWKRGEGTCPLLLWEVWKNKLLIWIFRSVLLADINASLWNVCGLYISVDGIFPNPSFLLYYSLLSHCFPMPFWDDFSRFTSVTIMVGKIQSLCSNVVSWKISKPWNIILFGGGVCGKDFPLWQ